MKDLTRPEVIFKILGVVFLAGILYAKLDSVASQNLSMSEKINKLETTIARIEERFSSMIWRLEKLESAQEK